MKNSEQPHTYSADETKTIKRLKRKAKLRRLFGNLRVLVCFICIMLALAAGFARFARNDSVATVATPTPVFVVVTATQRPCFVL